MGSTLAYRLAVAPPVTLRRDCETHTFDDIPTGWEPSFIHATRHLIDAYYSGVPPRLSAAEGRTTLHSLLAAHQSAHTGLAVRI